MAFLIPHLLTTYYQLGKARIPGDYDFYIDIEIDEPYSLIDGTIMHHDRTKNEERNLFFNEINWGIIRFTEKQIVETPAQCCSLINEVFNSVEN